MRRLVLLGLVFIIVGTGSGCAITRLNAEKKYQDSYLEVWNQLTAKQKALQQEEAQAADGVEQTVKIARRATDTYKQTKQALQKLTPPDKFKKLHRLTSEFLDTGIKYFGETARIGGETQGNYSDEQAVQLDKLRGDWAGGLQAVKAEAKRLGWQVK